ncbi:MAG: hypothetical protein M1823_003123 [Watsoniomyces obsoletus]|nr:MAG: hypothetical protein M1823_003123 [Watsoniomyces obsoletus]
MAPSATIPSTPRVISPTPDPSEGGRESGDEYFGPMTRSATRKKRVTSSPRSIDEELPDEGRFEEKSNIGIGNDNSSATRRSGRRTSAAIIDGPVRRSSRLGGFKLDGSIFGSSSKSGDDNDTRRARRDRDEEVVNGRLVSNGHLTPGGGGGSAIGDAWRNLSRSPSPLGLIPIHRHWRSLVHRHEIPRKLLHVSIGFVALYLYTSGVHTTTITPYLLSALIPIATVDWLRHRYPALNRVYIRICGVLMRESEVEGWNGTIWYLLGTWMVLRFCPKDIGVMSVLLLSWCDTAASTIGRAYGRLTPRIRRGKSLAGSIAAGVVGALTAFVFWGWLAPPGGGPIAHHSDDPFMFTGSLSWPKPLSTTLLSPLLRRGIQNGGMVGENDIVGGRGGKITGALALSVLSIWTGIVGAASEAIDVWGWDDNLTIPVLSGLGLWAFLRVFGGA